MSSNKPAADFGRINAFAASPIAVCVRMPMLRRITSSISRRLQPPPTAHNHAVRNDMPGDHHGRQRQHRPDDLHPGPKGR
jgi:hypothetical protein